MISFCSSTPSPFASKLATQLVLGELLQGTASQVVQPAEQRSLKVSLGQV